MCARSPFKDGAKLHLHHIGFWKGDRTNRPGNLGTVCEKCHIPKNHKPGGELYGLEPELPSLKEATFMTMVRFDMFRRMKEACPKVIFHMTYGAATKLARKELGIKKSHANDAYAMGRLHPKHRCDTVHYKKRRRNNRILSRFYDAKYIDTRDGSIKKGVQLSCGRTKRSIPRNTELNERICRGQKVSKGRLSVRRNRYMYRPHDIVWIDGTKYTVKGIISNGTRISLFERLPISVNKVAKVVHAGGWYVQNG